jgi:putative ABC transport system permease protein
MVDEDFVETFEVPIIAGRDYDKDREREDSLSILINRSMAKYLGYLDPEEAINQPFRSMSGNERIIGVIEDFSFKSFHHPIGPFVVDVERRTPQGGSFFFFAKMLVINLKEASPAAIAHVEEVWKKFVPNKPLAYTFLDDEIGYLYEAEQKMGFILTIFSAMAVFIACLGLFGLSSFMAAQRTKEIGIRKVLGASTPSLLRTVSQEYFFLIVVAILLAFPASWLINQKWLDNFAFQVDFSAMPFILSGILALTVALLTVMGIAMRAVQGDVVRALKEE